MHALDDPGPIYERMMDILCSITRLGLVHCDYNEFNVMLRPDRGLTVIDFPQMVSISHANAAALFDRDAACVTRFFQKKANYWVDNADAPVFEDLVADVVGSDSIDRELRASGFDNGAQTALDAALHGRIGADDDASSDSSEGGSRDSDEGTSASGDEHSDSGAECDAGDASVQTSAPLRSEAPVLRTNAATATAAAAAVAAAEERSSADCSVPSSDRVAAGSGVEVPECARQRRDTDDATSAAPGVAATDAAVQDSPTRPRRSAQVRLPL